MYVDFEKCILRTQMTQQTTNEDGLAHITPSWDENELRNCPICGGTRFAESVNEQGYRIVTACPGAFAINRIALFNNARIPARYMKSALEKSAVQPDSGLEPFQVDVCIDGCAAIQSFMTEIRNFKIGNPGRLFEGDSGTGKTHLLCAAIRYLSLQLGIPCLYADFSELVSQIRTGYAANNGSEGEILESVVKIPVLFLDELGKGRGTSNDFELRIIDEIVNRRYENPALTTFFATNYRDRASSGYNTCLANGYNPNSSSPMESKKWQAFARERWLAENKSRRPDEPKFKNVEEFQAGVSKLMAREHLEDRVSERTASRIMSMAVPTFIYAPDYRRRVQK